MYFSRAPIPYMRDPRGGFGLILRNRYLLLIAAAVVLLNLVSTTGDFILAKLVKALVESPALRK